MHWVTTATVLGTHFIDFVHVGKTGGQSVDMALRAGCRDSGDCHIRVTHVRRHHVSLDGPALAATVVSTRDPVSRVISAFNWRHPTEGGDILNAARPNSPTADPYEVQLCTRIRLEQLRRLGRYARLSR